MSADWYTHSWEPVEREWEAWLCPDQTPCGTLMTRQVPKGREK